MSGRKGKLPPLVEVLVVAAIVSTLACCLLPAVREAGGPVGDPLARRPPDEAHRFHSAEGFSIVVPSDWDVSRVGSLLIAPKSTGRAARRSPAIISMHHVGRETPSDIDGMRKTAFLGREAYEGMKVVRPWTFDDGAWSLYSLYFRHGGEWLALEYGIAEERTTLPDTIRRYISTFRWDEGKPGPATGPTSPSVK